MKYRVNDIPPEGIFAEGEGKKEWLESLFDGQERLEFNFPSSITYAVHLSRSEAAILVNGSLDVEIELLCSRCLGEFRFHINPEFSLSLAPAAFEDLPLEQELQEKDLDTEFYEGDSIDLGRIIQNQIVLNIPFNPLCREDCKGLCPHCGANKNQETCECSNQETVDSRLAILKNLLRK